MSLFQLILFSPSENSNPAVTFAFMAAIFGVFYFFMIRPQQKKIKEQQNFIHELEKGDKIVTNGGIHGKILKVDETSVLMEIDNNTKIRIEKSFISVDFSRVLSERKSD